MNSPNRSFNTELTPNRSFIAEISTNSAKNKKWLGFVTSSYCRARSNFQPIWNLGKSKRER